MTPVRCPVCRGTKRVLVKLRIGYRLATCLPCAGTGELRIISPAERALLAAWMPLDEVAAAKERQRKETPGGAASVSP
jgi:hypothetical protein